MVIIGVIVLLLGVYLVFDLGPLLTASGFVGVSNQQTVYDANLVVPVRPSGYNNVSVELTPQDTLNASMHSNPGGIDFLLMNQGNFSNYAENNGSLYHVYTQSHLNISYYSFVLNDVGYNGKLYLVFVSHSQVSSGNTDVLLHVTVIRTFVPSRLQYVPMGIAVVGVALIAYGAIAGQKKKIVREIPTPQSQDTSKEDSKVPCRFCGSPIDRSALFCPSCKKSQR